MRPPEAPTTRAGCDGSPGRDSRRHLTKETRRVSVSRVLAGLVSGDHFVVREFPPDPLGILLSVSLVGSRNRSSRDFHAQFGVALQRQAHGDKTVGRVANEFLKIGLSVV